MLGMSQGRRGQLAAEQAFKSGERLNPNRWIGKSWEFRDGFETTWAILEFMDRYDRGETEYLQPMYGLCQDCEWPLEDDEHEICRKCFAASAAKRNRRRAALSILRYLRNCRSRRSQHDSTRAVRSRTADGSAAPSRRHHEDAET